MPQSSLGSLKTQKPESSRSPAFVPVARELARLLLGFPRVLGSLPFRCLRIRSGKPQALERLAHALAALQTIEDRLRRDAGVLIAQVVRYHVGGDELPARQLGVGLLRR